MSLRLPISKLLVLILSGIVAHAQPTAKPYYYDAAISPNGSEIAFVTGGDIWTVPSGGGEARLLVSHTALESRPVYSPDGKYIAFTSTRTGNGDIYTLNLQSGTISRVTYDDGNDEINNWSPDSKYIYFTSVSRDITGMRDIFRVKASGGTPMLVSDARYVAEAFAAPSPDGRTLAFAARGMGATQWWRNGHSHIDESEIWLKDEASQKYTMLSGRGAKQLWPMWSPDSKTLYYVSDRDGKNNIWGHPINGTARKLTDFKDGRVLFPTITKDGKTIVFERDFAIWKMDLATANAKPVSITLKGTAATNMVELLKLSSGFSDLAVSPDGKKLAFVAQGELFAGNAKDGGDAIRITTTTGPESSPVWLKNSNSVIYTSVRDGNADIYQYDFLTKKETRLTDTKEDEGSLSLSPNGKKLAFVRDGKKLHTLGLVSKKETLLATAAFSWLPTSSSGAYSWSPDGKWIAFASFGNKSFRNVSIVPASGGKAEQISFLANTFGGDVVWANGGKSVLFVTAQRTEAGKVVRIDLQPREPKFKEDQFSDLFSDTAKTAKSKKATKERAKDTTADDADVKPIVYDGIRDRQSLLHLDVDVSSIVASKDGNTLLITADAAGSTNIYSYSLDEMAKETAVLKQITSTSENKTDVQFTGDKEAYYIENGTIRSLNIDSKDSKTISFTAEMMADFKERKMEVFRQVWDIQNKGFYDENYHGADWQAIRKEYEPYIAGAQTPDEMRRILNLMVGELNASHSGVSSSSSASFNVGRLGLRFDRDEYEQNGKFKITEVIASGPSANSGKIKLGDYLTAIDGKELDSKSNIDQLLENKVNKKLPIAIKSDGETKEVSLKPIGFSAEKTLLYNQWVRDNRDYVAKVSNGRLGYVHMIDMSQNSLDQLYLDIDAQNHSREGVIVDIRNNNGGFVNAYALDVLSRKGYMHMTVRGMPPAPARTQLGQRALDAPTILVTNQHSLSDAEDMSEGYRALGLGKIVGEPTAGWIIYTTGMSLFDGTVVRLPFIKVTDRNGQNMELAPRPVDVPVTNPLGDEGDKQLKTAVKELLSQLDKKK